MGVTVRNGNSPAVVYRFRRHESVDERCCRCLMFAEERFWASCGRQRRQHTHAHRFDLSSYELSAAAGRPTYSRDHTVLG